MKEAMDKAIRRIPPKSLHERYRLLAEMNRFHDFLQNGIDK